ncbi:hypothetical protein [Breoghania sp.]|uniref:hypothetical protein n=1 Tax=Breoghania sp. TaxID=2065378 RepID=UPI0029CA81E3|nr:hypothetical protein [Breoghania sp.]
MVSAGACCRTIYVFKVPFDPARALRMKRIGARIGVAFNASDPEMLEYCRQFDVGVAISAHAWKSGKFNIINQFKRRGYDPILLN